MPLDSTPPLSLSEALDRLGAATRAQLGQCDARYLERLQRGTRTLQIIARLTIYAGILQPLLCIPGVIMLAVARSLENMEIGHNVMHGQYALPGMTPAVVAGDYEWDTASPAYLWRLAHNGNHHVHAGIRGLDNDVGGMRLDDATPWSPRHLLQPPAVLASALFFDLAVAAHNSGLGEWRAGNRSVSALRKDIRATARKTSLIYLREFLLFPLLAGPWFPLVLAANLAAHFLRNIWAWAVILCNHCPSGVRQYERQQANQESRDDFMRRQIEASANFSGPRWLHLLSGHLGYHIEHHLYPDIPAWRYPELANRIRSLCEQHGIYYNSAPFLHQWCSAMGRIIRHALPG